ncbi:hypothetical protein [Pseudoalteromonas sp. ASV78]|uniref:hypothetical protein n=1 Tax=Pseudoalteromonas sp. ASV78 TaxID=3397851 RepID=UPI0039FCC8F3
MNEKKVNKKQPITNNKTESVSMSQGLELVKALKNEPAKVDEWFSQQRLEMHKFANTLVN